ncbi:IS110 family transposase [Lacihabitans sp. CCS-44]|uniref:IS110 family transposase n=1 Tax=Lacihabitans sp. CCS-44 TaxID=2487331 RepID=UPI0020CCAB75|nr:IS110 family transposase [Lacihabitans sp. CCS-44]MCP9757613.1 IS110 family transposase [Lacihabitans sp. CCS-44]
MKKVLKQAVGIDVALDELVVTFGQLFGDLSIEFTGYKVFKNSNSGILALLSWVEKLADSQVSIQYIMEATGVYHEKLAYHLDEKQYEVCVVLPNKISNYMRTLESKTVTDKSCSQAISQFGLERKLDLWTKPNKVYKKLQQLTRERDQIVQERSIIKNQIHAEKSEAEPNQRSLERMESRIKFLSTQEKEIKIDIEEITKTDIEIQKTIERITTIPGVGSLTAVTVLAETNGFELIRNKSQLASYAGLDVKEKQSGTSVKGKPRISKKGNRNLRKSVYLPALSAVRWDEHFKNVYARLVGKHGIKMKALVAIQRKILELIYVLFKNGTVYDKEYHKNSVQTAIV